MTEVYWIGKTAIIDWVITDPTSGDFVTGATVAGTVTKPDGNTTAMTVTELDDRYRATYEPAAAGLHAWRLTASGTATGAEEGTFVVHTSLGGAAAIETDPTTDIGMIRLLTTDLNEISPLFTDAQLSAMLTAEGDSVKYAAALALETIAVSQTLLAKKIRTQDLQTDGPAVAAELRARAAQLRAQADSEGVFSIVDFDPSSWYDEDDGDGS